MTDALAAIVVLGAIAPALHGAMRHLRARLQGRPGPGVLQPYRDLAKLWRKEAILPQGVSILTAATPGIVLGVAIATAAFVPRLPNAAAPGDAVALVLLLAVGRFALTLAALDMRSAFTGMAASRELTFATLAEPALVLALLAGPNPLTFAAFFIVLLLETARIPIDNQETHYELTMMHEGLALEYSGWQLALVSYAAYVRQAALFVLAARLATPQPSLLLLTGVVAATALGITLVETLFAKLRLFEVPQLLASAFILAAASIGLRLAGMQP